MVDSSKYCCPLHRDLTVVVDEVGLCGAPQYEVWPRHVHPGERPKTEQDLIFLMRLECPGRNRPHKLYFTETERNVRFVPRRAVVR